MIVLIRKLILEEGGQGMVEYGFILALIVVAVIGALTLLGETIMDFLYEQVIEQLIISSPQGGG